ncbi:MAG: ATP-binding cassette domain-containing protein, partial [Candidatus Woesearchaeota archaeon]
MLKTINLKKHFGGVKAVDGVSLEIKKGRITAIIGPNGSGKTTLFNLVSGVIVPDDGRIFFKNIDITGKSIERVSNHGISRMFQKSRLFSNLTVMDNLEVASDDDSVKFWKNLFGVHNISKQQNRIIVELLKKVETESHTKKLCKDLSFGQKRLI